MALRDGMTAALEAQIQYLQVEGDNQIVINALKGIIHIPWEIHTLIQDVKPIIPQFRSIYFTHVFREANMAADWMAKHGCFFRSSCTYFSPPCREFLFILVDDNLGRTLAKRIT